MMQMRLMVYANENGFLSVAVERLKRMKSRNKMASRANKEKRKKSTATPIACNTHTHTPSTYTILANHSQYTTLYSHTMIHIRIPFQIVDEKIQKV